MAVDPQLRQDILDTLDEVGATMNQEGDVEVITQMDDSIADKIMLPGVQKDDSGSFVKYIQASLAIFYNYVKGKADGIASTWDAWFGTSDSTGVKGEWGQLKSEVNEIKSQAQEATSNANEKAGLANEKAGLAASAAAAANEKAGLANEKAGLAQGIYDTVASWFNGDSGFKASAESWLAARRTEWDEFFSDSLATGCRKLWTDFWNTSTSAWNGFFGNDAEDTNGVRKIWSTWFSGRQSEWNTLKDDAQRATGAADDAAGNANEKAGLANEKAGLAASAAAAANEKAGLANEKAGLANEKAGLAEEKAGYAQNQGDYAKQQGDRAKLMADHRDRLDTDGYIWRYDPDNEGAGPDGYYKTDQYINAEIDPSNMTDEQISEMLSRFSVDFASTQTCETAASDPDSLTEEEKGKAVNAGGLAAALLILNSLVRAPYFEGNTLVFPSTSSMRFEGTTLILAE